MIKKQNIRNSNRECSTNFSVENMDDSKLVKIPVSMVRFGPFETLGSLLL